MGKKLSFDTDWSPIFFRRAALLLMSRCLVVNQCWEYQGLLNTGGYGMVSLGGGAYTAHRLSYFILKGLIPEDLFVCHTCDNRRCINPEHLFLGTSQDNVSDMHKKGRARKASPKGEQNPCCKLSDEDVRDIKRQYASTKEYAIKYGVNPRTIRRILTGGSRNDVR